MGQHLSEPVVTKDTSGLSNSTYRAASSSMQGWRISMEDAHTVLLSMKEDKDASFFAVFDGHGGSKVAEYCGNHLHRNIVENEEYKAGNYIEALKKGFLTCDEDMQFARGARINETELKSMIFSYTYDENNNKANSNKAPEDEQNSSRMGNLHCCKCTYCTVMPSFIECKCCEELWSLLRDKLEADCATKNPNFESLHINEIGPETA